MATIKDIAEKTGLGVATISKFLNGGNVRPENRRKIEKAIKELDYRVNEMARALKSNRSRAIGVVIPELSNLFITNILTEMESHLRQRGYSLVICDCHTDPALESEAVQFLLGKMVDGLVSMPVCPDGRHLKPALGRNVPVVLIDRAIPQLQGAVDMVLVDNAGAAACATEHLLAHGHRDIGIIVGPREISTSAARLKGYIGALEAAGIKADGGHIIYSDYTIEGGYCAMQGLLQKKGAISAAFVTNYEMTLGAIMALNDAGVEMPEGLSLIGFDNMHLARVVRPSLAVVTQPLAEIGQQAAGLLMRRLDGMGGGAPVTISLSARLQPGGTVAAKQGQ